MYLQQFPDIVWLKDQIKQRFATAGAPGWPNVVLNVAARETYRPNIAGPLTLFMNVRGTSRCTVGRRNVLVDDHHCFLTNAGDEYTLEVDRRTPAETFNIHFGERFAADLYAGLTCDSAQLLDEPSVDPIGVPRLTSRLSRKDGVVRSVAAMIRRAGSDGAVAPMYLEEQLARLLRHLIVSERCERLAGERIGAVHGGTRREIVRRLLLALDRIHGEYRDTISLDDLAVTAMLSKFHFLRLFTEYTGMTPHRYIVRLRMETAAAMLRDGKQPIGDVAMLVGCADQATFSRQFRAVHGVSASGYRRSIPAR